MSSAPIGIVSEQTAKRASAIARLSPAAKHQAFPGLYAKPVPMPTTADGFAVERQELTNEINRLKASLASAQLELSALKTLLPPPPPPTPPRPAPTIGEVMEAFCRALQTMGHTIEGYAFTVGHIQSPRRARTLTAPRHVAMWLVRGICKQCSLPTIGKHFGHRDHTSIMHGCERAPMWMEQQPILKAAASIVLASFESKDGPA